MPGDALEEATLERARAGDDEAFRELTDPYRRELQVHCYRILGSLQGRRRPGAGDAVGGLAGPRRVRGPSLRAVLALPDRDQPVPERAACQVAPPVLGFRTAEVAEMLETGEISVKGALQRAREALRARLPAVDRERAPRPNSAGERQLVGRFADAFQTGDVNELVSLLTDDALLTMPPLPLVYQGHEAIAPFLRYRVPLRGAPLRVVPTRANTQPALGCYLQDAHAAIARPFGLMVLTLEGDRVSAMTRFDASVFPYFGLPRTLRVSR